MNFIRGVLDRYQQIAFILCVFGNLFAKAPKIIQKDINEINIINESLNRYYSNNENSYIMDSVKIDISKKYYYIYISGLNSNNTKLSLTIKQSGKTYTLHATSGEIMTIRENMKVLVVVSSLNSSLVEYVLNGKTQGINDNSNSTGIWRLEIPKPGNILPTVSFYSPPESLMNLLNNRIKLSQRIAFLEDKTVNLNKIYRQMTDSLEKEKKDFIIKCNDSVYRLNKRILLLERKEPGPIQYFIPGIHQVKHNEIGQGIFLFLGTTGSLLSGMLFYYSGRKDLDAAQKAYDIQNFDKYNDFYWKNHYKCIASIGCLVLGSAFYAINAANISISINKLDRKKYNCGSKNGLIGVSKRKNYSFEVFCTLFRCD